MPGGPKGEKRPADVIGNAVHVMRVATGEKLTKNQPKPAGNTPGKAASRAVGVGQNR
jgi:hypothetical protein